jgi:hypothetical protein
MKGTILLINIADSKSVFKIRKTRLIQKDIQNEHENGFTSLRFVNLVNKAGMFKM